MALEIKFHKDFRRRDSNIIGTRPVHVYSTDLGIHFSEAGDKFVFATIPQGAKLLEVVFASKGVDKNATTVQARLSVFAAEIQLPVVDLLPEFRASLERDGQPLYYRFDGHLNEHGHQRLAEIVLTHLLALGLLPPS